MESDTIESDTSVNLPGVINIKKFVSVRLEEAKSLKETIENPKKTAMVVQQLPKHMRRRVMSYTIKRMPKRLREAHARLLEKCNAKKPGKRPSRKFRRRPKNLRAEYSRRQREFVWLETHIWHAKRFHMVSKWGYRLPHFPNDKGFRACYRASDQHALLQDISYLVCIELVGGTDEIVSKLASFTCEGASFSACPYRKGAREGETLVISPFSEKPFGRVKFLWSSLKECPRRLWLWAHPAFYSQLHETLVNLFSGTKISVNLLKDEFVRFKLTGAKSLAVVATCLSATLNTPWTKVSNDTQPEEDTPVEDFAWKLTLADDTEYQKDFFDKLCKVQSHNELCPRAVIPATVQITIPNRKEAFRIRDVDLSDSLDGLCERMGSPLWCSAGRLAVKQYMQTRPKSPVVPVILIQNPNNDRGYGGGVDLVTGGGCGMALWLALVHSGGRAGGLRETDSIENFSAQPPMLPLDSSAGAAEESRISVQKTDVYYRLPPAKRRNYIKLGVACPFTPKWTLLSKEWDGPLIRIQLEATNRGSFPRCSLVCVPQASDKSGDRIEEDAKEDSNESIRKQLRENHRVKLQRLARARKRARAKQNTEKISANCSQSVVEEYNKHMRSLWIPEPSAIRMSCSRQIAGFVTAGGYHPGLGHGVAIAYIAEPALKLLANGALVRSPDSLIYRWAIVKQL